jgi:hypothetical protein
MHTFIANGADDIAANKKKDGWAWGFNSSLQLVGTASQNHDLVLYLALCLQKKDTSKGYSIFDGTSSFQIQNWTDTDWQQFQKDTLAGANLWNDKFWLIPPPSYKELAWPLPPGEYTHIPNIKCKLEVNFMTSADAHMTITVAHLDDRSIPKDRERNAMTFNSAALLWDNLDNVPRAVEVDDNLGRTQTYTRSAVPHEIGHALGMGHIGVLKKTTACLQAIADEARERDPMKQGGSNSLVCYGWGEKPSLAANIMGFGSKFDAVNAKPWLERIAAHTETNAADWKVSMKHVPPRPR